MEEATWGGDTLGWATILASSRSNRRKNNFQTSQVSRFCRDTHGLTTRHKNLMLTESQAEMIQFPSIISYLACLGDFLVQFCANQSIVSKQP